MRVLRLLPFVVLFSIPLFAQSTPPAQRDPQAIAVVQAAIAALGGTTAITQYHSWTFQADMEGVGANGHITYSMGAQPSNFALLRKPNNPLSIRSFFVPASVGAVLANEFKDPRFAMQYLGPTVIDSKSVTAVALFLGPSRTLDTQIWYFDGSGLPVRVNFRLPGELGPRVSYATVVDLSDYRSVSGVLHPFRIVTNMENGVPEVITVQSVTPTGSDLPEDLNGPAGDLPSEF
jgi:hypothetical protein